MEQQEQDRLYIDLKKKICGLIYKGTYQEGERIPPERVLAEEFGVSRITVRKTLELIEKDGLIIRQIGRGTTVCFQNRGARGSLDMTALVAPARSAFFSQFIEYFQQHLDKNDVLLLYVQKPERETIENCIYRLYSKDIRNVVVWPDDAVIDSECLRKLRALGMNMVFFDTDAALPYADCVHLDNELAVRELLTAGSFQSADCCYLGWDNQMVFSVRERETCFRQQRPEADCLRLSWGQKEELRGQVMGLLKEYLKGSQKSPAFLCGAGEIGVETAKALKRLGIKNGRVLTVDEFKESKRNKVTTYGQDFVKTAEQIYDCLKMQNEQSEVWKAKNYPVGGVMKKR